MRLLTALAALAILLAGCIQTPDAAHVDADGAAAGVASAIPAVDAAAVLADVKAFSEAYPMRRGDNDAHNAARAHLAAGYEKNGYELILDEFEADISPTSTPTSLVLGSPRLVNVCGIKWGTANDTDWVVIGAHYDVTDGAVYGAYDDASGTMIVQRLAEAFAPMSFPRTLVFCNFDGEEQGLRGSRHMVEAITEGTWAYANGTVIGMIDFDMAGIMYPASPVLVADAVSPEFQAVITAKREELGIPEDKIAYRGIRGGSSDNGPFKAAEIPSVLFISDFDEIAYAGQTLPGGVTYPFWHQLDTYEGMVELAEGEENLRAGFQNVVDIGAALLHALATDMQPTFQPFE
jgi:hypothetical protein